jgi:hypothetical protein
MSTRRDVENGRLVYTCNCGWVDTGHADPTSRRPNVGAASLWDQVKNERGGLSRLGGGFKVTYAQDMRRWGLSAGVTRSYYVRQGLTLERKEAAALAIFMEVSYGFEDLQGSFPYNLTSSADSSFSEEDLVSDLIGFYIAVRPGTRYLDLCQRVSVQSSLHVWDTYGSVGSNKNRTFQPVFHPCDDCRGQQFPAQLQAIRPAQKGGDFRDWRLVQVNPRMLSLIGYPPGSENADELLVG